jgi:hypothetical protein
MNINLDTLVEMVEKTLTLSEQENIQSIYKTAAKLRINKEPETSHNLLMRLEVLKV